MLRPCFSSAALAATVATASASSAPSSIGRSLVAGRSGDELEVVGPEAHDGIDADDAGLGDLHVEAAEQQVDADSRGGQRLVGELDDRRLARRRPSSVFTESTLAPTNSSDEIAA